MKPTKENTALVHPRDAELVPASEGEFALVRSDQTVQEMVELINDMSKQKASLFDWPQIKAPAGGGMALTLENSSGKQSEREIRGLIVAFRQTRAFWKKPYGSGGGKKPPDCSSTDGFVGIGDPGGSCPVCPNAQFNTAHNPDGSKGAGQACKDTRQLLVLVGDQLLPYVLNLPPTSIRNFERYVWNLTSEGLRYWGVVTRIVPESSVSTGGVDYARLRFFRDHSLDRDQVRRLRPYHECMQGFLKPMVVDASAYEVAQEEPPPAASAPRSAPPPAEEENLPF